MSLVTNMLSRRNAGPTGWALPSSEATDRLQRRQGPTPVAIAQTQCRAGITRYLTGRLNVISPQHALLFDRPKLDLGVVLANPLGNMQVAGRVGGLQSVSTGVAGRYKVGANTVTGGIVG